MYSTPKGKALGLGRKRRGAAWAGVIATILLVFATALWVFSQRLSSVDEAMGVISTSLGSRGTDKFGFVRTVTVVNKFSHSVYLYAEDGMSGSFVAEIPSEESAKIGASNGHVLYATEPTGWTRISTVVIRSGEDSYALQPSILDAKLLKKRTASKMNHRTKVELEAETRTRAHPDVIALKGPKTTAMAAKFRSMSKRKVEMWYDDGGVGTEQGHLVLGQETTTNTYAGHVFFFTVAGHKDQELARFTMNPNQVLYVVYDKHNPPPPEMLAATRREEQFMAEYFNRTGIHWRHYYGPTGPRPPPVLYMWPAKQVGVVHKVQSPEGYWSCDGSVAECQSSSPPPPFEMEVVSLEPRVFVIPNFLSAFEAEHISKIARPRMAGSSVGDVDSGVFSSNTRTSKNAWVGRKTTSVTESLFMRAADVLNIDEKLLTRDKNAEDMQVVHYVHGQKYDSHHDWGVSGHPQSRLITLLIYLTDQETPKSGGETSFPKGGEDGQGFKVRPVKGQAVLFYNLLEDGNGDDKALHAALPVHSGEKMLAVRYLLVSAARPRTRTLARPWLTSDSDSPIPTLPTLSHSHTPHNRIFGFGMTDSSEDERVVWEQLSLLLVIRYIFATATVNSRFFFSTTRQVLLLDH